MKKQKIEGNHNQQAGRDIVNIHKVEEFDPENTNIITCPSCWKPTSKWAEICLKCGFGVKQHFEDIEQDRIDGLKKQQLNQASNFAYAIGAIGFLCFYIGSTFESSALSFTGAAFLFLSLFILSNIK